MSETRNEVLGNVVKDRTLSDFLYEVYWAWDDTVWGALDAAEDSDDIKAPAIAWGFGKLQLFAADYLYDNERYLQLGDEDYHSLALACVKAYVTKLGGQAALIDMLRRA